MVEHATAQANEVEHPVAALKATVQEKIAAQLAHAEVAIPTPSPTVVEQPRVVEPEPAAKKVMAPEVLDSRERREKLRERLKAASAKVEPSQPTPQSPAEARTSALALVAQLRQQLEDTQRLNAAQAKDLDATRADLARSAEEARARTAEASRMAIEVAERARLIEELGKEMASLEGERDDTLVGLQGARAQMEQQAVARQELEERLAAREAELAETLTEEERLAAELESRNAELRQSQVALAGISVERDQLAKQVGELTRERADLLDSQKALDEIHRALADARVRVGTKS